MTVTLFGCIWLLIMFWCFFSKKSQTLITLTLISMIFQCTNVIEINNQGIGPQLFTSIAFIIRSYFVKSTLSVKQNYTHLFSSILFFIFYLSINSLYYNSLQNNILNILQLLIYIYCAIRLNKFRNLINEKILTNQFLFIVKFMVYFSPIQFLATKGFISRDLLVPLFFNDMGENVYFHNPEAYQRLLGTFLEPSFCAPFLVGSFFFLFHIREKIKNVKILLSLIIVELIMTTSSTGYVIFIIMFLVYTLVFGNKKNFKFIIPTCIIFIIFFYLTKDNLLQEVLFNKMESDSGKYRAQQDLTAISLFLNNPIIGSGIGTSRASSMITTLLAEMGIIGITIYFICSFISVYPLLKKKLYTQLELSSRLFILSIILSQMLAIPDLQYCVYWFSIYLIALSKCPPNYIITKFNSKNILK